MKRLIILSTICITFLSCSVNEKPEFLRVENIKVLESTSKYITFTADALFINPNDIGGGGIKPLKDFEADVCEIQKMYFSPKIRGKGYGKLMFEKCIQSATNLGYKQCYLESSPQLEAAIHIYETFGFKHLKSGLGNTGHFACGVWMIKDL